MNGLSVNFGRARLWVGVGALLASGVSGCADVRRAVSLSPVNPESPVAAQVRVATRRDYATPRLNDVPPVPRNVPSAEDVKLGVISMVRCRGGVAGYGLSHPPLSGDVEQFAANQRDVAQVNPADVPPANSAALSESDAANLRAVAAPPAAIASGPAPRAEQGRPPVVQASSAPHAAIPRRGAAPRPATVAAPPPPSVAATASGNPASGVTASSTAAPPMPAPLPDPLLARCS